MLATPLQFLAQPLPDLLIGDSRPVASLTTNPSVREAYLADNNIVNNWSNFETTITEAIRQAGHAISWRAEHLAEDGDDDWRLRRETFQCGNEHSLQGRFAENALVPAVEAFKQINARRQDASLGPMAALLPKPRVGDGRICPPLYRHTSRWSSIDTSKIEADIVLTCEDKHARAVGELKTCWTVKNMRQEIVNYRNGYTTNHFGHALGQLFLYMEMTGAKLGFISTYQETVLVRFEQDANRRCSLYLSEVIRSTDHLRNSATNYRGSSSAVAESAGRDVTTKQAMLYLMLMAAREQTSGMLPPLPKEVYNLTDFKSGGSQGPSTGNKRDRMSPPRGTFKEQKTSSNESTYTSGGAQQQLAYRPHADVTCSKAERVLVPPSAAWRLKASTFSGTYKLKVPEQGWVDIKSDRLSRDENKQVRYWSTNWGTKGPGYIYCKAA